MSRQEGQVIPRKTSADSDRLRVPSDGIMLETCEKRLDIVPSATHLFEEPGALEEVARLARGWFERHLAPQH
jgi:hypothetical protein